MVANTLNDVFLKGLITERRAVACQPASQPFLPFYLLPIYESMAYEIWMAPASWHSVATEEINGEAIAWNANLSTRYPEAVRLVDFSPSSIKHAKQLDYQAAGWQYYLYCTVYKQAEKTASLRIHPRT